MRLSYCVDEGLTMGSAGLYSCGILSGINTAINARTLLCAHVSQDLGKSLGGTNVRNGTTSIQVRMENATRRRPTRWKFATARSRERSASESTARRVA